MNERKYVDSAISSWTSTKWVNDGYSWEAAKKSALTALSLDPNNPKLYYLMGNLYEWRAFQRRTSPDIERKDLTSAEKYYKKALKQSPAWAVAWSKLGRIKFEKNELDEEGLHAFDRALDLGRWDRDVQKDILWMGISHYDTLDLDRRQQLGLLIQGIFRQSKKVPIWPNEDLTYIVDIVRQYNWLENFKSLPETDEQRKLFNQYLKLSTVH